MELFSLDSNLASSALFQPVRLIENYDSLIWTERYSSSGDFELVSSDVPNTLKMLPLESFVTLRESTVPMVVESHKIEKPKGKHARITVTGRSFESVLERRATRSTLSGAVADPRPMVSINADKVSDAAYKMLREAIGDIARSNLTAVSPANPDDVIPQANLILPTDYTTGTVTPFEIKFGNLLSVLYEMLEVNRHGIRSVRPAANSGKVTVDLEIYNGANLTGAGANSNPAYVVAFDARFDQFDSSTYLFSYQGSANVAYVYGPGGVTVRQKSAGAAPSGLARRVLLVDEASDSNLNTDPRRSDRGIVELYKNNAIALFDGETSVQIASRFNKPVAQGGFGLGDILLLNGEYATTSRTVRVVEWIRSSDSSGEKAYPAFETVEE
jgi:hypothetical protein